MKKILFLLLCTVSIYGQVSTGQEQEFDYGIKNNSTQTVTTPTYLGTVGADGTYGKILLADLQGKKAFLSTGLIKNGLISANGDPTKFNITAGIGIISNFDDPENPVSTIINFPAFTGITPTYLLTGTITYVAINDVASLVMQATPFTPEQRRSLIVLGAVVHSNLTTINVINNISAPSNASTNQLHDFIEAVGALNLTGNKYTANGANLQLDKSAGLIFKLGSNFANDWKNPHELAQTAGTSLTFRYRTQNGTEGSDRVNLDPALYDLNNVLTAVPNNKFTIQTVTMFQSGVTRIQYGQNVYDDLATAKNAVFTRNFVLEPNSKENGIIRAYIIMKNTTTSLQNVADADILEAQKFGGVASGGVALTLANIVTALGYTPENVANKTSGFSSSSTLTYPNTQALVDGLATKENTFSKNTAFNKNFGTTAGTVIEGGTLGSNAYTSTAYLPLSGGSLTGALNGTSINSTAASSFATSGGNVRIGADIGTPSTLSVGGTFRNSVQSFEGGQNIIGAISGISNGFIQNIGTDNNISYDFYNGSNVKSLSIASNNAATFSSSVTATSFNGSATLTGNPTAPTPTLGDNDTSVATTAYVLANSLALSGSQTITGRKTFTSDNTTAGGINITNSKTTTSTFGDNFALSVFNTGTAGIYSETTVGTGTSINSAATSSGSISVQIGKDLSAVGLNMRDLANTSTGNFIQINPNGAGIKFVVDKDALLKLREYTVATLPTPTGTAYATVTDALAPTYMATVVGGGAVVTPVFYNGTNWVAH